MYELAAKKTNYPLHLGVTEAGPLLDATIKTIIGLGSLIEQGIGDTLRVSISGSPLQEPIIAKKILHEYGLYDHLPSLVSCPTCGRCEYNLPSILDKIIKYLDSYSKPIKIAVMGCPVNGIGEAKNADIGIFGTNKKIGFYYQGKFLK